jgi:hypothetical protein
MNAPAARIGPTVCELDGPMPIEKRSSAETKTGIPSRYADAHASGTPRDDTCADRRHT